LITLANSIRRYLLLAIAMEIIRCLAVAKRILDGGYVVIQKTPSNHQAFFKWHLCNDAKNA